jgi:hypothetical protein
LKPNFSKFNGDIVYVALYRLFQVGSVGLTSIIIPFFINEIEQGIYFLFLNLLAAQLLFELGLNQAIIQVSSHVENRKTIKYRDFTVWIAFIYNRISVKFYCFMSLSGSLYLYYYTPNEYLYVIFYWLLIMIFASMSLSLNYRYALIESENKVFLAYQGKIIPLMFSSLSAWLLLFLNYGLLSIAIGLIIQSLVAYVWLKKNYPTIMREKKISQKNNLYIKQLKLIKNKFALSYIGGYIGFNSLVPIVYAYISPADAGRAGLSLALFSAVTLVATSFVTAKNNSFAKLISICNFQKLNNDFKKYFLLSVGSAVLLSILVFFLIDGMNEQGYNLSSRLMDNKVLIGIAFAACGNTAVYAMAIYVRSHKVEPFVTSSLVTALVTIVLALLGVNYSADWSVYGYVTSVIVVSLPWAVKIFTSYYKNNIKRVKC